MAKTLKVDIVGDAKDLYDALDKSTEKLDRFGRAGSSHIGKAEKAVKAFKIAGLASIPVVGLLSYQLFESVKAAADTEKEYSLLRATIRNSGESWKHYQKQVRDTIETQSLSTGFARDELIPAYNTLDRATGSVTKSSRLLSIAEDVARGKHISVASAAATLGKAWDGNLSSLKRLGVDIPKNATKLEALRLVQKKFHGEASAYGKTAAGGLDRLNVAYDKIKETIGEALLPVIIRLTNKFTDWLTKAQKSGELRNIINKVRHVIRETVDDVGAVIDAFKQFRGFVSRVMGFIHTNWPKIKPVLALIISPIRTAVNLIGDIIGVAKRVINYISDNWPTIKGAIKTVFGPLRTVAGIFESIIGKVETLIGWIDSLIGKIKSIPHPDLSPNSILGGLGGLLPHTGGIVTPQGLRFASGGIAVGGSPGRDSIPAMLSPGEVVLNKRQQLALLRGGTGEVNVTVLLGPDTMREFARVEVEAYGRRTTRRLTAGSSRAV